jgi:hypothetical protein
MEDDWAALCLNSYDDALNGLFFLVTPKNVRASGTLDDNNRPKFALNLKWESRAGIVDGGWIAEMVIPMRSLAFQGSDRVTMSFKVARFISRKSEEVNLPEMKPERREPEQYREIVLHEVVPSSLSPSDAYKESLENLRRNRLQLHSLPYGKQFDRWGDASVLDYLIFGSRELRASRHPFHFQYVQEDRRVAASLATTEYAPGKRVGHLERFLTRSGATSFMVVKAIPSSMKTISTVTRETRLSRRFLRQSRSSRPWSGLRSMKGRLAAPKTLSPCTCQSS